MTRSETDLRLVQSLAHLTAHRAKTQPLVKSDGLLVELDAMLASEAWEMHALRTGLELDGFGYLRGVTGELLMKQMQPYMQAIGS